MVFDRLPVFHCLKLFPMSATGSARLTDLDSAE